MFERLTDFTRRFAQHPHALWWLFFYSVIESVFFPIPPDVLLIPMALMLPGRALLFAFIAALGSATGGVVGYFIGFYAFEPIALPLLNWSCHYVAEACPNHFVPILNALFAKHGVGVVAVSAMSPIIPYRFTILAAGLGKMPLAPFIVVSFVVHWFRYSILSYIVARYGRQSYDVIRNRLPLAFTIFGVIALAVYVILNYV